MIEPPAPGTPFDLVLLDRDGTLNVRVEGGYVTRPDDLVMLPGAAYAVGRLSAAGCRTVLVTNQRGIARGLLTSDDLAAVHRRLDAELTPAGGRLDAIAVCPHEVGQCSCRKPQDGLFRAAFDHAPWALASRCVMIGDMPSDLVPASRLGIRTRRVGGDQDLRSLVGGLLGDDPAGDRLR